MHAGWVDGMMGQAAGPARDLVLEVDDALVGRRLEVVLLVGLGGAKE